MFFFIERLFQTFWKTQGHWYLSRRTLKLTRRTLGHYPIIKDELQTWLKELKSSKPLSETFTDATYLDQTQATHFYWMTFRSLYVCMCDLFCSQISSTSICQIRLFSHMFNQKPKMIIRSCIYWTDMKIAKTCLSLVVFFSSLCISCFLLLLCLY